MLRQVPLTLALALALGGCKPEPAAPAAPASPPAQAGPAGPRAEAAAWQVELVVPAEAKAGAAAQAQLVLRPKAPYHVNREYPLAFRPAAPAVEAFGGARVALGDSAVHVPCEKDPQESCGLTATLPFTPRAPGDLRLEGVFAFSVCVPERCLIEKAPLAATVAVR